MKPHFSSLLYFFLGPSSFRVPVKLGNFELCTDRYTKLRGFDRSLHLFGFLNSPPQSVLIKAELNSKKPNYFDEFLARQRHRAGLTARIKIAVFTFYFHNGHHTEDKSCQMVIKAMELGFTGAVYNRQIRLAQPSLGSGTTLHRLTSRLDSSMKNSMRRLPSCLIRSKLTRNTFGKPFYRKKTEMAATLRLGNKFDLLKKEDRVFRAVFGRGVLVAKGQQVAIKVVPLGPPILGLPRHFRWWWSISPEELENKKGGDGC